MRTASLFLTLGSLGLTLPLAVQAQAPEYGRVLSATPVVQQIAVPQQVCNPETIYNDRRPSGAGAVVGAIAGGAMGNAIGGGSGRAAATALGVIGGAILGNEIEGGQSGYQTAQRCTTETYYDERTVGYDVVYEYAGRQYTTRTATNPGQWIALTVQPAQAPGYAPPGYPTPYGKTYRTPATPAAVMSPYVGVPVYPPASVTIIQERDGRYPPPPGHRPHRHPADEYNPYWR